VDTLLRKLK